MISFAGEFLPLTPLVSPFHYGGGEPHMYLSGELVIIDVIIPRDGVVHLLKFAF